MPNIASRPYVGTWKLNNQLLVKHTPDALVYLNGDLSIPGCDVENTKINIQPYIKGISVDASTEPGGHSGNIQMAIPRVYGESLFRDGRSVIRPTLEVHIYMRGYFPLRGMYDHLPDDQAELPNLFGRGALGAETVEAGLQGPDVVPERRSIKGLPTYPYYHVFHGVITQANYEYSDGFYNMTIAVASMLHFWQYQVITTNGSAFGARPRNSGVKMSLVGHNLTGKSPYGIIYMLYKDTAGAAAGVGFALSGKTNTNSVSQVTGRSLYSMSLLYWERRFKQTMYGLRMHGTNGRLFNGAQQAFLGSHRTRDLKRIAKGAQYADSTRLHKSQDPFSQVWTQLKSRRTRDILIAQQLGLSGAGFDVAYSELSRQGGFAVNVLDAQAYVSDISNWGNVNLWESEYETKLDIANKVREISGFEFYQDVDGDLVFKPPFYNMDTAANRIYRIEDIDIISINFAEKEPNTTVVTMKGSAFKNLGGTGLDNEWGVKGQYIDYRLVAQFGWRMHNMDISYFANPRSMFYAAVNKLDLLNIDTNSAQCTIPIRPELRPGYPVYIPFVDSYYYVTAFSHAFQFGGQCTTTLTLTARRSKFFAPGVPGQRGIDKIKLDDPYLPPTPLGVIDNLGLPRLEGFPNVVLALDPAKINPKYSILGGISLADITNDNLPFLEQIIERLQQSDTQMLGVSDENENPEDARFHGPWFFLQEDGTRVRVSEGDFFGKFKQEVEQLEQLRNQLSEIQEAIIEQRGEEQGLTDEFLATKNGEIQNVRNQIQQISDDQNNAINVLVRFFNAEFNTNDPQGRSSLEGVRDVIPTSAYLDFLSDVKSNFVSDNIPGYYVYYSASHPNPDYQGQKSMTEKAGSDDQNPPVRLRDNQIARLKDPTTTRGFLPANNPFLDAGPGQKPPEAVTGPVKVTNGLLLAGPRGSAPQVVPTHLIETISFASVVFNNVTGIPGVKLNPEFYLLDKNEPLLRDIIAANMYNDVTQPPLDYEEFSQQTLAETFGPVYDRIYRAVLEIDTEFETVGQGKFFFDIPILGPFSEDETLNFPRGFTRGLAGQGALPNKDADNPIGLSELSIEEAISLPAKSKSKAEAVRDKTFFTFGTREGDPFDRTNQFTPKIRGTVIKPEKRNKELNSKARKQLQAIAFYYAGFISTALVEGYRGFAEYGLGSIVFDPETLKPTPAEYARVGRLFNGIVDRITGVPFTGVSSSGKLQVDRKKLKRIRRLQSSYTPVFPVSDARGYEVFGSYRYGRGIDVEPGGLMQQIYEQGVAMMDAFEQVDAETIDLFLKALRDKKIQERAEEIFDSITDDGKALDGLSRAEAARRGQVALSRAAALAVVENFTAQGVNEEFLQQINQFNPSGLDEGDVIEGVDISRGANAWTNRFANTVATNQDEVFTLPVANGAYLLRDLASELDLNQRGYVTCRGSEADLLLEAFGRTQFLSLEDVVEGREPVAFMQERVLSIANTYLQSQNALRGEAMEFNGADDQLFDAWRKLTSAFKFPGGTGTRDALFGLSRAVDGFQGAIQSFRRVRESGQDVRDQFAVSSDQRRV